MLDKPEKLTVIASGVDVQHEQGLGTELLEDAEPGEIMQYQYGQGGMPEEPLLLLLMTLPDVDVLRDKLLDLELDELELDELELDELPQH